MTDKPLQNVIEGAKIQWRGLSKRNKALAIGGTVLLLALLLRACG